MPGSSPAMRNALRPLAFLVGLVPAIAGAAGPQFPQTLSANNLLGRLGNGPGPVEQIPFSILIAQIGALRTLNTTAPLTGGGNLGTDLTISLGTQVANQVLAGPTSGGNVAPNFRALVGADLPNPGASSLGGAQSKTCSSSNWFNSLSTGGVFGCTQPAFTDIAGAVGATQLPNPGASSKGGVQSIDCTSGGQFIQKINTDGTETCATPAGGGNVSNSGTPTNHQTPVWISATQAKGVGPGTTGQQWTSNGASSDPSFQSGGWVLLNTLTASNSATLSDITSMTAAFSEYEVVFINIVPATNAQACEIQVHSGGSFQATGYKTTSYGNNNGGAQVPSNPTTFIACSLSAANTGNSAPGTSGAIRVWTPSTSALHEWSGQFSSWDSAQSTLMTTGGFWNTSAAIDGFQVLFSSGNITSGTIKIYARL